MLYFPLAVSGLPGLVLRALSCGGAGADGTELTTRCNTVSHRLFVVPRSINIRHGRPRTGEPDPQHHLGLVRPLRWVHGRIGIRECFSRLCEAAARAEPG
jgi:hypothetical protein